MKKGSAKNLIRPLVRGLHAYVPGEQPKIPGLIKLNTNENPYPPSPRVLRAVKNAVAGRLRLYPNPTAQPLRDRLARLHRCAPENVTGATGSAGAPPSARAGLSDVLEGVFALLPAGRILRRPGAAHRRARQDPRQLQRQRAGADRRPGDAGGPALLSAELPADHCRAGE